MNKPLVSFLMLMPATLFAGKSFMDGSGGDWDCGKDPVVSILTNNATYHLKGACTAISINGNDNTVVIDSAKSVAANGNKNKVTITTAETVSANGNENNVTIAKGSPKTSSNGMGNKIVAPNGTASATPAPAGDATAVDCAKTPTYKITSGDGSYKFTGTCTKITVSGGGSKNSVTIGATDSITVAGGENAVTYKKGLSGDQPNVKSVGSGTKVEQAK
ncbi:MAG TPA: DUF3060 domain-containing protein [Kofleriaceae bacterium]